ncbi:unnamed protein product [Haemonchus placei]|uniref:BLOC-1-related complex subunit 7 n=1 Tax=Haemonchus placei TaxID=6290 RepID=A0A0N4WZ96_HAEPC|nr:unnamed protein product [Haemonchus placei]
MASPANSEQLLRTSSESDFREEMDMDDHGETGVSFFGKFEKFSRKLITQMASIAVTCDRELARTMRTDDPIRDSVIASVSEQSALVKELARTALKEIGRELAIFEDMRSICVEAAQKLACLVDQIRGKLEETLADMDNLKESLRI